MAAVLLIVLLGGAAFAIAAVIAAVGSSRAVRIFGQVVLGVAAIVLAWSVASKAGVFAEKHPDSCTDCGEDELVGLALLAGNSLGWTLGTLVGGLVAFVRRRQRSGSPSQ